MATGLNDPNFAVNPYMIPLSFDKDSFPFWLSMWQQTQPNLGLDTEQATGLSSLLGGGGIVKKAATDTGTPTGDGGDNSVTKTGGTTPENPAPTRPTTPPKNQLPLPPAANDPSRFVGIVLPGIPGISNPGVGVPVVPANPTASLPVPAGPTVNVNDPAFTGGGDQSVEYLARQKWRLKHPGVPYPGD